MQLDRKVYWIIWERTTKILLVRNRKINKDSLSEELENLQEFSWWEIRKSTRILLVKNWKIYKDSLWEKLESFSRYYFIIYMVTSRVSILQEFGLGTIPLDAETRTLHIFLGYFTQLLILTGDLYIRNLLDSFKEGRF